MENAMLHRVAVVIDRAANWLLVVFFLLAAFLFFVGWGSMEGYHLSFLESTWQVVDSFQSVTGIRPGYILVLIGVLKVFRYILVGKEQITREPNDA
jgi:hypothetical protein